MISVNNRVESLDVGPPSVVTVAANTSTDVLAGRRGDAKRVAYRFIQNLTGADLYFAYDCDCKVAGDLYHGVLQDKLQLSVPCKSRVSVFSVAGGKVAITEFIQNSL